MSMQLGIETKSFLYMHSNSLKCTQLPYTTMTHDHIVSINVAMVCKSVCCLWYYHRFYVVQALKLLGSVSDGEAVGALQLAAQVHFRLDQGQQCVEAYNKLKSSSKVGQVSGLKGLTRVASVASEPAVVLLLGSGKLDEHP